MINRFWSHILRGLLLGGLLLSAPFSWVNSSTVQASASGTGEILLVAKDLMDLHWDPTTYPYPNLQFVRWELWRGTSLTTLEKLTSGTSAATDFYRDTGLASGITYHYRLDLVRCSSPCDGPEDELTYTVFSDSATAGFFHGTVVRNLALTLGVYHIGSSGLDSSVAVYVKENATLDLGSEVTITVAEGISNSSILVQNGSLNANGTTFDAVGLSFGDYYEPTSQGKGTVANAQFINANIMLSAQSDVSLLSNRGNFSIFQYHTSHALIQDNTIQGSIELKAQAYATIKDNVISNGSIEISGYGMPEGGQPAFALISGNTITSTYYLDGISADYGATVVATDNYLEYTAFHGSEAGVLITASSQGTTLTAERNHLVHGKIGAFWGPEIEVVDNVLVGEGAAIAIGCVLCGTTTQATGSLLRNTVANGWGLEMWGGSQALIIQHNCIQGNDPGLTTDDATLTSPLDARYNWWGDASGPRHPTNPGGTGDRIEGSQVLFDPWDLSGTYCRDLPPPPPEPRPGSLELGSLPISVPPDGTSTAQVTVLARDDYGQPLPNATVTFEVKTVIDGIPLGGVLPKTCTTGQDGTCATTYLAPWPDQVFHNGAGIDGVTVAATAGPAYAETEILIEYLGVTSALPQNGTRNVDWTSVSPYAVFDRTIKPESIGATTFQVSSSIYYHDGFTCNYDTSVPDHAFCLLDLSDATAHPNADQGLIITAELKGGPNGVLGQDGTFLKRDYAWKIYTTPALTPKIIPVQISEGAPFVSNLPAVVRVQAGLSDDTELDWVKADVTLAYDGGALGTFNQAGLTFYPGEFGYGEVSLRGHSANFYSQENQVPVIGPNLIGSFQLEATITPSEQHNPPQLTPRQYSAQSTLEVRPHRFDFYTYNIIAHPVAPSRWFQFETYPWQAGTNLAGLLDTPLVTQGAQRLTSLFPLPKKISYIPSNRVMEVTPPALAMNDPGYLPGLIRLNGYNYVARVDAVVMIVPQAWLKNINHDDPIFHGADNHTCIVGDQVNPYALPHCLGDLYGLTDHAMGILRGYDLARDRYLNNAYPDLGYMLSLMNPNLGVFDFAQTYNRVWIDQSDYQNLVAQFTNPAQATTASTAFPSAQTIALGGEIRLQGGAPSGAIDITELPASNPAFSAPGGSGEYSLRLKDGAGTALSTHAFTPEFSALTEDLDYASFIFTFPVSEEVAQVELLRGTTVLDQVAASLNAPQLALTQAGGGSYTGLLTVSWSASDADADQLHYRVFYSTDDGANWLPVTLDTTIPSLELDSAQYANCVACRIKVIASDGFHTVEAISNPFAVTNPPQVTAVWPPDNYPSAGPRTTIEVRFRDPMQASDFSSSTFTLQDAQGNPVAGSVTYDVPAQVSVFTPALPLKHGKAYTVRLSGTLREAGGQELGSDYSWSFQVEIGPFPLFLPLTMQAP